MKLLVLLNEWKISCVQQIAFDAFDESKTDRLSIEDMVRFEGMTGERDFWVSIIDDIDPSKLGGITFEQFCELVEKYAD